MCSSRNDRTAPHTGTPSHRHCKGCKMLSWMLSSKQLPGLLPCSLCPSSSYLYLPAAAVAWAISCSHVLHLLVHHCASSPTGHSTLAGNELLNFVVSVSPAAPKQPQPRYVGPRS